MTIVNRALSSVSGERKQFFLSKDPNNMGVSSLVNHGVSIAEDGAIEVESVTLRTMPRKTRSNVSP